jgi:hypothetical protein
MRANEWRADQDDALAASISARTLIDEARRAGVQFKFVADRKVGISGKVAGRFLAKLQRNWPAVVEALEAEARAADTFSLLGLLREITAVGGVLREENGNIVLWVPDEIAHTPAHVALRDRVSERLPDVFDRHDSRHVRAAFDIPPDTHLDPNMATAFAWLALEDAALTIEDRCSVAAATLNAAARWPALEAYRHRLYATFSVVRHHIGIDAAISAQIDSLLDG